MNGDNVRSPSSPHPQGSSPRRNPSDGQLLNRGAGHHHQQQADHPTSGGNKYMTRLNDDSYLQSSSRPPRALLSMKGSASDSSIVDIASGEDSVDAAIVHQRKRSGSVKKRVGNVFKSMKKPSKSKQASLESSANSNSTQSHDPVETSAVVADVGFTSPYNKRSHTKDISPPERDESHSEQHQKQQKDTDSPKFQLKNLEAHKDLLSKSIHGHNNKELHKQHDEQVNSHTQTHGAQHQNIYVEKREINSQTPTSTSPHPLPSPSLSLHKNNISNNKADMIHFNSRLAVVVGGEGEDQGNFFIITNFVRSINNIIKNT